MRHAHTSWNGPPRRYQGRLDVSISEVGKSDARESTFDFSQIDLVISSPALRCRETIRALSYNFENLFFDPRLWEIDMGIFSGRYEKEVMLEYPELYCNWQSNPTATKIPKGESFGCFYERVIEMMSEILQLSFEKNILLMTHGGVMRLLYCHYKKISYNQFNGIKIKNLAIFSFDGYCYSELLTSPRVQEL